MYPLKLSTQKWTISNAMKSCLLEIKSCLLGIKSCLWILNRSAETLLENERGTGLLQIDHNARGRAGWKGLAIFGKTRKRRGTCLCYYSALLSYILPVDTQVVFFAFCCENGHIRWMNRHPVSLKNGQIWFLMVFHVILKQISNYCFCTISLREFLSVLFCTLFPTVGLAKTLRKDWWLVILIISTQISLNIVIYFNKDGNIWHKHCAQTDDCRIDHIDHQHISIAQYCDISIRMEWQWKDTH